MPRVAPEQAYAASNSETNGSPSPSPQKAKEVLAPICKDNGDKDNGDTSRRASRPPSGEFKAVRVAESPEQAPSFTSARNGANWPGGTPPNGGTPSRRRRTMSSDLLKPGGVEADGALETSCALRTM
jgi:hypothetical protein